MKNPSAFRNENFVESELLRNLISSILVYNVNPVVLRQAKIVCNLAFLSAIGLKAFYENMECIQ